MMLWMLNRSLSDIVWHPRGSKLGEEMLDELPFFLDELHSQWSELRAGLAMHIHSHGSEISGKNVAKDFKAGLDLFN